MVLPRSLRVFFRTMKWDDRIGRRLTLRNLQIFVRVAESGNMGKAAERLAISQPSVSRAIAEIERAVGVPLLDRTAQGVDTTIFGRALLKRGIQAFDELRQGIADIESLADPTAGEVRVGCPEVIACGLLLPVLVNFSRQQPGIVVRVFPANDMSRRFDLLKDRSIDLLIGGFRSPVLGNDLVSEILYRDRPFIVSGASHRLVRRRKIELGDVIDEPWLLPPESIFTSLLAEAFHFKDLIPPMPGVRTFSAYQRLKLLATGSFVSAESGSLLRFNMDRFSLRVLPVDLTVRTWPIAIVALKNRAISSVVHSFIDCVREAARVMDRHS
jgi:DNA-binding transcriptional LysR family regulator